MNISYLKSNMISVLPPVQPILQANSIEYTQKLTKVNPACFKSDGLFYHFSTGSSIDNSVRIIPEGCRNILFDCDLSGYPAIITGINSDSYTMNLRPNTTYFGVKLYCSMGLKGWKASSSELYNNYFELKDVLETKNLEEKIALAHSFKERINIFVEHVTDYWADEKYTTGLTEYIAMCLCVANGNISMKKISEFTGYSSRYCRKVFASDYYIPPKEYARLIRFQKTVHMLLKPDTTTNIITDIVYENGYFDESHFINDFKSFTGASPSQFIKEI